MYDALGLLKSDRDISIHEKIISVEWVRSSIVQTEDLDHAETVPALQKTSNSLRTRRSLRSRQESENSSNTVRRTDAHHEPDLLSGVVPSYDLFSSVKFDDADPAGLIPLPRRNPLRSRPRLSSSTFRRREESPPLSLQMVGSDTASRLSHTAGNALHSMARPTKVGNQTKQVSSHAAKKKPISKRQAMQTRLSPNSAGRSRHSYCNSESGFHTQCPQTLRTATRVNSEIHAKVPSRLTPAQAIWGSIDSSETYVHTASHAVTNARLSKARQAKQKQLTDASLSSSRAGSENDQDDRVSPRMQRASSKYSQLLEGQPDEAPAEQTFRCTPAYRDMHNRASDPRELRYETEYFTAPTSPSPGDSFSPSSSDVRALFPRSSSKAKAKSNVSGDGKAKVIDPYGRGSMVRSSRQEDIAFQSRSSITGRVNPHGIPASGIAPSNQATASSGELAREMNRLKGQVALLKMMLRQHNVSMPNFDP